VAAVSVEVTTKDNNICEKFKDGSVEITDAAEGRSPVNPGCLHGFMALVRVKYKEKIKFDRFAGQIELFGLGCHKESEGDRVRSPPRWQHIGGVDGRS
jgi:hypothetical protein